MHTDLTNLPVLLLYNIDRSWPIDEIEYSQAAANLLQTQLTEVGHAVEQVTVEGNNIQEPLKPYNPNDFVVFNWCEEIPGIPHSSALVAWHLEQLGYTYTGADSKALLFSQDKSQVKKRLVACHIPTPRWKIYRTAGINGWDCFPAIVKPMAEHFSLGISHEAVVHSPAELSERVGYVLKTFHQPALVEDFIDGREFHVTLVGNGRLHMLPIAEMDFSDIQDANGRLCTFDSKFNPDSLDYRMIQLRLPASLTEAERSVLEQTVLAAYHATGCRDYARFDVRLRDDIFYILDANPNADISPDTSMVLAAEMVGLSYGQLGSWLINLAARRHPVFGSELDDRIAEMVGGDSGILPHRDFVS